MLEFLRCLKYALRSKRNNSINKANQLLYLGVLIIGVLQYNELRLIKSCLWTRWGNLCTRIKINKIIIGFRLYYLQLEFNLMNESRIANKRACWLAFRFCNFFFKISFWIKTQ